MAMAVISIGEEKATSKKNTQNHKKKNKEKNKLLKTITFLKDIEIISQ